METTRLASPLVMRTSLSQPRMPECARQSRASRSVMRTKEAMMTPANSAPVEIWPINAPKSVPAKVTVPTNVVIWAPPTKVFVLANRTTRRPDFLFIRLQKNHASILALAARRAKACGVSISVSTASLSISTSAVASA